MNKNNQTIFWYLIDAALHILIILPLIFIRDIGIIMSFYATLILIYLVCSCFYKNFIWFGFQLLFPSAGMNLKGKKAVIVSGILMILVFFLFLYDFKKGFFPFLSILETLPFSVFCALLLYYVDRKAFEFLDESQFRLW